MAEFNVADGSVATVLKEGSPLALMKGYQENVWFFAPRAARITRVEQTDHPQFVVVRNRKRLTGGQGLDTVGGVFACQIELNVPLPTVEEQNAWTEQIGIVSSIRPVGTSTFRFQPMRLRDGRMSIQGIEAYVTDPTKYQDIPVGSTSTIPITLELNKLGADTFASALNAGQHAALPVTAFIQYKYDMVVPSCHYKITADSSKVYDFFSVNVKARASYWGLVGGHADISHTREELISSAAIKIEQISRPEALDNERIKQLEAAIIDAWVKGALAKIAEKPQMNPAEAPNPKGFFGGVSVTMKSRTEVEQLHLSAEFNYSELSEEIYSLSYVFGPLLSLGSPADHLLDVTEDNKLPVVINLGKDPLVYRYSGQFGYRKQDGTFISNVLTDINGKEGGVLTGVIQFATTEPMPEKTEVQLTVDWEYPDWEDRVELDHLKNNESGAAKVFSPGNNIARVLVVTDLERAASDTISVINYHTIMPDYNGNPVKVYSGAIVHLGQGQNGKVQTTQLEFPYYTGTQNQSKLAWDVTITRPDGTSVFKNGEIPVTQGSLPLLGAILTRDAVPTPADRARRLVEVLPGLFRVHPINTTFSGNGHGVSTPSHTGNGATVPAGGAPPPSRSGTAVLSKGGGPGYHSGDAW